MLGIQNNCLTITPNQRLSADLKKQHQEARTCETKNILPWNTWLKQLWLATLPFRPAYCLSPTEELYCWQRITKNNNPGLLSSNAIAKLAMKTQQNMNLWQISLDQATDVNNDSNQQFIEWSQEFDRLCASHNWVTETNICAIVITYLDKIVKGLPKHIKLYQFLELTPVQQHFFDALKTKGIHVEDIRLPSTSSQAYKARCATADDEIKAMVLWAKEKFEQNDTSQIACVSVNLNEQRDSIERAFKQIFNNQEVPIDFSAGFSLNRYPIVNIISNIVALNQSSVEYLAFSQLLRSPFIANAESELTNRHQLDKALRDHVKPQTSLKRIIALIQYVQPDCDLVALLSHFKYSGTHLPSQHAKTLLQQITQLGWPGQRTLDSTEYQLVARTLSLLEELATCDPITGQISYQQFIELFQQQLNNTIFQIETDKTRIQILGLLEASGLQFDHMWVMGMDDLTWPSKAKPNILLPYHLQIKHNMPHCSPERELNFCQALTKQLIRDNKNLIFSHANQAGDKTLRPSPLISHLSETQLLIPKSQMIQQQFLEEINDQQGPPLSKQQNKGGSHIVKLQSLCPFQAFARLRLQADTVEEPTDGLDHLDRGILIHSVLEFFWRKTKSQKNLFELTDAELDSNIKDSIEQAFKKQSTDVSPTLIALEKKRQFQLILEWLSIEKKRDDFSVSVIEGKRYLDINGVTIRMQVDRIDTLSDGTQAIIDYKTGSSTVGYWFGDRPKEPQLPMYCVSNTASVSAVLFAQIRQNDMAYKGVSNQDMNPSTIKKFDYGNYDSTAQTWQQQQLLWQETINELMQHYIDGHAEVDPVDASACQYCQLHSVCRVSEHV